LNLSAPVSHQGNVAMPRSCVIHPGVKGMSSTMSIDDGRAPPAPPPAATRLPGLRPVLILASLFETCVGYSTLSAVSSGPSQHSAQGLTGVLNTAQIVSHPLLAAAAMVLALIGRVRDAIIAMAAILAMNWLSGMPSVVLRGFEPDGPFPALLTGWQLVAVPLMAACAIALAARNQRLGLATALASIPTFYSLIGLIIFAVGVSIYGF
jgi:hypothetical protein